MLLTRSNISPINDENTNQTIHFFSAISIHSFLAGNWSYISHSKLYGIKVNDMIINVITKCFIDEPKTPYKLT